MTVLNPPGAPTGDLTTQDIIAISRFLNDPTMLYRALRTIADQMYVSDKILKSQIYTDSGSILYEQIESIFAGRQPQAIEPGGEYPLAPIPTGPAQIASTVKWGLDTLIFDESIARQNWQPLQVSLVKLINSMVDTIDSVAMSAIVAAITQQQAAGANSITSTAPTTKRYWDGSGDAAANILRDVMMGDQVLRKLKQGYVADTVLCDLETFALVFSDEALNARWAREDIGSSGVTAMPVFEGLNSSMAGKLAGKLWLGSPNLPTSPYAAVIDTKVFGGMADEKLPAPGYTGATTPGADADGGAGAGRSLVQTKSMREDSNDRWRVRARRITTPFIVEPLAAVEITGILPS
ncbi:hypothetical protein ABW16_01780 [Mycolicibacter heraklionensis]|uniref:Major capsid protein n=1 Tax=Mycolicibacter heraklionensis TaxID=512402 RepID=A0ABR5FKN7_9MYCO|nr:hypothetical protein [Mycolicibacter heraklionensis]KLO31588.1 hypothetical protein ABW16_01780 [Mycolicibacter heraklionensis]